MTYEGLLTFEEAKACEEAGYSAGWLTYRMSPEDCVRGTCSGISSIPISVRSLFAPWPGHWLPMATAPRDGRFILVRMRAEVVESIRFDNGYWTQCAGRCFWTDAAWLDWLGWQPIVTAKDS